MVQLLCRIIKLTWLEGPKHQTVLPGGAPRKYRHELLEKSKSAEENNQNQLMQRCANEQ